VDGLQQTLQKTEGKCKEMDLTNEKLEKQIRNLKNEIEICNRTVSLNKDEYSRMLNTLEKEHKHTLSLSDSEKTREIQSLTDKIEQLNIVISSQRTNLDTMTKSLTTVNSECVKLREIVDQQGDAVEHIKRKDVELQSMRLEYNRMKANLATGLNLNAKGHTEREKELTDLRAKLKDIESKDVQLKVLKDQLSNVQQYYGQKISKLEEDSKKEKEEHNASLATLQEKHRRDMESLNKTIVELQIQNAKYEQKIQIVRLEYEKKAIEQKK
jgi:chromosome segregation ATPase